jgi:hypothetical protein
MAMDEMDVKRLSTQEAINTSIAKMTELLAGPAQFLTSMLDNAAILYSTMVLIGAVITANVFNSLAKTATALITNIALTGMLGKQMKKNAQTNAVDLTLEAGKSAAKIPIIGAVAAIAAMAAIGGLAAATLLKAGDLNSPADGKTQISTKEGGLFELSKNDDIVAFPGASQMVRQPKTTVVQQTSSQPTAIIDYDKMAAAISRVTVQSNLDGVAVSSRLQTPMGIATRKI